MTFDFQSLHSGSKHGDRSSTFVALMDFKAAAFQENDTSYDVWIYNEKHSRKMTSFSSNRSESERGWYIFFDREIRLTDTPLKSVKSSDLYPYGAERLAVRPSDFHE